MWVDSSNDWIYRHVHRAEALLHELAARHAGASDDLLRRALNQLARELLLAQSSDWAFIMKTGTAVGTPPTASRATSPAFRSWPAKSSRSQAQRTQRRRRSPVSIDADWLAELERRDNIFPDLDFRLYA